MAKAIYETEDVEERNTTVALLDLFDSVAKAGATEDPMVLVCKSLVRCIDAIQFAYFCYDDDETGQIAAVRPGVRIYMPPPDVQRKILADLRRQTLGGAFAEMDPRRSLVYLTPAQRRKWKCHRGLATALSAGVRPSAILAVFTKPEYVLTDRHRTWLSLFRAAAAALLARRSLLERVRTECDEAVVGRRLQTLAFESARQRVRTHLAAISEVRSALRSGLLSLKEALNAVEASARPLYELSDVTVSRKADHAVDFRDPTLGAWVRAGLGDPRIKALVGLRGSSKSSILHAVRSQILSGGVDERRVVIIDFEHARFRHFRTADDVMAYLNAFPASSEVNYLFMDEVGKLSWHTRLLDMLQRDRRWNVWITTSTLHGIAAADARRNPLRLLVYHTWVNPNVPRSNGDLERIWCKIFMRDVVSGIDHPDIRAKENLAEYYSDHLGEANSLREISRELAVGGRRLSSGSIRAYRQALVDANLIEFSGIYDVFGQTVVASLPGRVFYTDLELRTWRFGSAPGDDERRLSLNRLYLDLRRKFGEVYTPQDGRADFLTLDGKGNPMMWKLPVSEKTENTPLRGATVF